MAINGKKIQDGSTNNNDYPVYLASDGILKNARASATLHVGDVKFTARTLKLSDGWERCSGQVLTSTTYPTLYNAVVSSIDETSVTDNQFTYGEHFVPPFTDTPTYINLYYVRDDLYICLTSTKWYYTNSLSGTWTAKTYRQTAASGVTNPYQSPRLYQSHGYYVITYGFATASGGGSYSFTVGVDYLSTGSSISNTWNTFQLANESSYQGGNGFLWWPSQNRYVISAGKKIFVSNSSSISSTYTGKWYINVSQSYFIDFMTIINNRLILMQKQDPDDYLRYSVYDSIPSNLTAFSPGRSTYYPDAFLYANSTLYWIRLEDNYLIAYKINPSTFALQELIRGYAYSLPSDSAWKQIAAQGSNTLYFIRYNDATYWYNYQYGNIGSVNDSGFVEVVSADTFGQALTPVSGATGIVNTYTYNSTDAIPANVIYVPTSNFKLTAAPNASSAGGGCTNLPTHLPTLDGEMPLLGAYTHSFRDTNVYIKVS